MSVPDLFRLYGIADKYDSKIIDILNTFFDSFAAVAMQKKNQSKNMIFGGSFQNIPNNRTI